MPGRLVIVPWACNRGTLCQLQHERTPSMASTGLDLGTPQPSDPQAAYRTQVVMALAGIRRSAGWFDWIAALSIVNSVISLFNGSWHFVVGLGITELIDGLAQR